MKKIIITISFIVCAIAAYSQNSIFKNPDNHAYWGAKLDLDFNIPGAYKTPVGNFDFSSGVGVGIGAYYNMPIVANLYFEPGLTFYFDTFKTGELTVSTDENNIVTTRPRVEKVGFRVPLLVGYRFDVLKGVSVSAFTGPELGIGLSAKLKDDTLEKDGMEMNLYSGDNVLYSDGAWHRFGMNWQVGASVTVDRFTIGLTGSIGLTDVVESDKITFRENAVRLSAAYNF